MAVRIRNRDVITKEFNTTIWELISKLEKKSRSEQDASYIDRLKQRIRLLRATLGDQALLAEAAPFFIEYRAEILDPGKYERLIMSADVRREYLARTSRTKIPPEDEFMFNLVDSVRTYYSGSSNIEKDAIYNNVRTLFNCCVENTIAAM